MNQVACPHCGMIVMNDGSLSGQSVACPQCGGLFVMPAAPEPEASPPSSTYVLPPVTQVIDTPPPSTYVPPPVTQVIDAPPPSDMPAVLPPLPSSGLATAGPLHVAETHHAPPSVSKSNTSLAQVLTYVLAGIGVAVAIVIVVLLGQGGEPVPQRKQTPPARAETPDDWIRQLRQAPTEADRSKAAAAIANSSPEVVMAAIETVIDLEEGGKSYRVDKGAMACLVAEGPKRGRSLVQALHAKSEKVRIGAAYMLREMGPEAIGAREALIEALDDESRWVRRLSTAALGNLGRDAAPAVEKLTRLLSHEDKYTRLDAAEALGHIGPDARAAVPALKKLVEEESVFRIRRAAEMSLAEIQKK